jgi:PKD repeat protein
MCRNHTGLRTAGKMGQLAIYSGDKSSVAASHFAALSPGTTAPTADFTGTPLSGSSPLSVAFTDTSTNEGGSPTFLLGEERRLRLG